MVSEFVIEGVAEEPEVKVSLAWPRNKDSVLGFRNVGKPSEQGILAGRDSFL